MVRILISVDNGVCGGLRVLLSADSTELNSREIVFQRLSHVFSLTAEEGTQGPLSRREKDTNCSEM